MNWPRIFGLTLQAIVVGTLLFLAVIKLIATQSGAQVFHYQGF